MPTLNCPHCGQLDQVQQVSGLMSSGTISGSVAGEVTGFSTKDRYIALPAQYPISATTALVDRLKAVERRLETVPPAPNKPRRRLQPATLGYVGGTLTAVSIIAILVLLSRYTSYCTEQNYAQGLCDSFNSEEPFVVVWAITLLLGLAFLVQALRERRRPFDRVRADSEYADAYAAWLRERHVVEASRRRFLESVYCHRCDRLFVPGDPTAATVAGFR